MCISHLRSLNWQISKTLGLLKRHICVDNYISQLIWHNSIGLTQMLEQCRWIWAHARTMSSFIGNKEWGGNWHYPTNHPSLPVCWVLHQPSVSLRMQVSAGVYTQQVWVQPKFIFQSALIQDLILIAHLFLSCSPVLFVLQFSAECSDPHLPSHLIICGF